MMFRPEAICQLLALPPHPTGQPAQALPEPGGQGRGVGVGGWGVQGGAGGGLGT